MTAAALLLLAAAGPTADAGAPPRLTNARVQTLSAAAGVEPAVRRLAAGATTPVWIGYAVPVDGPHSMCCWESMDSIGSTRSPGCRLEGGKEAFTMGSTGERVDLEADARFLVLLRAQGGRIGRIRALSWECAIDAGGLPVHWLTGVPPPQSARLLASLVEESGATRDGREGALLALALHAEPAALDRLVAFARRSPEPEVRSQALFWLSQKAGRRAAAAIEQAVDEDPESEVRERAVFALSQLPRDEGVPRLIALARSHRDRRVRQRAIFWLGQSQDQRALAFFEEILRP